ncbi:unnamed protein product [Rotaria sordida]|uniref:Uncharacterized protein n=1 Tax=Rotaria sordida TaxID=392033 RepID=A0A815C287_9BILA|nr:unnamed protein product [Rotaria sordida]CAF1277225.1 unnamed protein product [Rotaria sordida]CAF3739979.1 unnamed protein product [Rotaria sordida]CAF3794132.1 unnamed protein product [Rotaria sordida]CAF3851858.1 unnamed protein product [Rotaria sordida]
MISFTDNHFKRLSMISSVPSSSKDSVDSQLSIKLSRSKSKLDSIGYHIEKNYRETSLNERSKEKTYCSGQLLFSGPLILCIILLISGILLFIIVGQKSNKYRKKEKTRIEYRNSFNSTDNDSYIPILCPFSKPEKSIQTEFALSELNCARHRSSLIHMYYLNNSYPINPGEKLIINNVIKPPTVQLNFEFLSKLNSNSFVLILIDPIHISTDFDSVVLHWIRYFSSSLDDEHDICHYKFIQATSNFHQQKIVLLYATNSSKMMIRAKTICNRMTDWFQLTDYVMFIKLKLIGATHFLLRLSGQTYENGA